MYLPKEIITIIRDFVIGTAVRFGKESSECNFAFLKKLAHY